MDEYDESMAVLAAAEACTTISSGSSNIVYVRVGPISGQACPTCGRRVPMTGAERTRRWRAKNKPVPWIEEAQ